MGRRSGYEYSHRFWMDDEIIPLYDLCLCVLTTDGLMKSFLFEIRTNFKLKRIDHGHDDVDGLMMMGSERFGADVAENLDERWLENQTSFRLKDYWMSDDEIQSMVRGAFDFAKRRAADHPQRTVIPVVVGIDVCTVQQEGEPITAAIGRAITPKCMIPLYVWQVGPKGSMQVNLDRQIQIFLWDLPRIRVKDDLGLALMEVCPVCSRNSSIGAQISVLPCNHACHSHCVFQWLHMHKSDSCPLCSFRIPTDVDKSESEISYDSSLESEISFESSL